MHWHFPNCFNYGILFSQDFDGDGLKRDDVVIAMMGVQSNVVMR